MQKIDIYLEETLFDGIDNIVKDAKKRQMVIDSRTDSVARMLAMYPTTNTRKLAKMFHVSYETLVMIAKNAGVKKVETRGGHNRRKVEVVNLDGCVECIYESLHETSMLSGVGEKKVQYMLTHRRGMIKPGTIIRYKRQEEDVAVIQQQTGQ